MQILTAAIEKKEKIKSLSIVGFGQADSSRLNESLGRLTIYADKIKSLPAEINKLCYLETVEIGFCDKLDLAAAFRQLVGLPELKGLYVNRCGLKTVPGEIGLLTKLKTLSFSNERNSELQNNELATLPPEIDRLSQLEELMLGALANSFQSLPAQIAKLEKLRKVSLNNSRLPGNIDLIPNLTELDLTDAFCTYIELTALLKKRPGLRAITVRENDLSSEDLTKEFPNLIINIEPLPIDGYY